MPCGSRVSVVDLTQLLFGLESLPGDYEPADGLRFVVYRRVPLLRDLDHTERLVSAKTKVDGYLLCARSGRPLTEA